MRREVKQFFSDPQEATKGNTIELLAGGASLRKGLFSLIQRAKFRVHIVIYEFAEDAVGKEILEALIDATRRGCEVKVVYDAVGSIFTRPSFFNPLIQAGGIVHAYHSIWPLKLDWKFMKRNHRKIICVDAEYAMVGGFNFSAPYFMEEANRGYYDLGVLIEGPAASQAYYYFDQSLQRSDGQKFQLKRRRAQENRAIIRRKSRDVKNFVHILGNDHFIERWRIRRELLFAFSSAKRSIDIMNPYFLPDPAVIKSLIAAVKRGVKVRILVPSYTDVKAIDLASSVVFHRLIGHGVEIFRWPGFLHGKAVSIDKEWFSIGTFNLDYRSLFHNLEVVVNVYDPTEAGKLSGIFEAEYAQSARVTEEDWNRMSFLPKLFANFIYRMRAFL